MPGTVGLAGCIGSVCGDVGTACAAIEARAAAEDTTTSEIIREALRRFLEVA